MARVFDPLPDFSHLDDASAELILKLQLDDVKSFKEQRKSKGKQKEGDVDDSEYAATLLEKNLCEINMFLTDRRMTRSVAIAVQADGRLLEESAREEQTAREDRALANRLSGRPINSDVHLEPERLDDASLSKLAGQYVSEDVGQALECGIKHLEHSHEKKAKAKGSGLVSYRPRARRFGVVTRQCEACHEPKDHFDLIRAPCGHEYCIDCTRDLFNSSLTDESLFPPKCCRTPIPLKSVEIFIPKLLKQAFEKKNVEFGTPNRTYCSRPTCSAFIEPNNIADDVAVCPQCHTETCTLCKAAAHSGTDCPNDENLQAMLDLARESGWQRCYGCRRVVELDIGCNHMTCPCGAQFCYECGVQWKKCTCAQWRAERLLSRANQIVQRDAPRLAQDDPARAQRVEQAAAMLRERHVCNHRSWQFIRGPHQCEECRFQLPDFIFECEQCRIQACKRCKNNRL